MQMPEPQWNFDKQIGNYKIVSLAQPGDPQFLGQGNYGKAVKGWDTINNREVAVKIMKKELILSSKQSKNQFDLEIKILREINNNNIVKLFDVSESENNFYLLMELCDGCLSDHKSQLNTIDKQYKIIIDVINGFQSMFEKQIIHRDIKPDNILIKGNSALIGDFGFARFKSGDPHAVESLTRKGNMPHMAPQILCGDDFSAKCDVFSVGILAYNLVFSQYPWAGDTIMQRYNNINKKPLVFPDQPQTDEDFKNLLKGMLAVQEDDRFGWDQVFQQNFVIQRINQ